MGIFNQELIKANHQAYDHRSSYSNLLYAGQSLFAASENVTAAEFRTFTENFNVISNYFPVLGVSYVEKVPKADLNKFIQSVRSDRSLSPQGDPSFSVSVQGDKPYYYIVRYAEPIESPVEKSIGVDVSDIPGLFEVMEETLNSGTPEISRAFKSPITGLDTFIEYLPIYHNGDPHDTAAERHANAVGFLAAIFEVKNAFNHVLFIPEATRLLDIDVFQGATSTDANIVYDDEQVGDDDSKANADPDLLVYLTNFLGNPNWTARVYPNSAFYALMANRRAPTIVLLSGGTIGLLFSLLIYSLIIRRQRALDLAGRMTIDLEKEKGQLEEWERWLFESQRVGHIGTYDLDLSSNTWTASEELDNIFGIEKSARKDVDSWTALIHPEDRTTMVDYLKNRVLGGKSAFNKEYRIVRQKDGTVRWVWGLGKLVFDAKGNPARMVGTIQDITDRKLAEAELQRLNRTLMTISEANEATIRATDERVLLKEVCDILVRNAGYKLVWVGYVKNDQRKSVEPMAWAGHNDGYVESLDITWADAPNGRGPTGVSIREKRVVVDVDFTKDPNFTPWLEQAIKRGYKGSVCLPLMAGEEVFGSICIYTGEANVFTSDEIKMLQELASDLTFSILSIRNKAEKDFALTELRKTAEELEQFQLAVTNASDHIIITNPDGKIIYANKGAENVTGYPLKEIIGKTPALWGKQMPKEFYEGMWKTIKIDKKPFLAEITNRRKNGELYQSETSISPILDEDGNVRYFVGVERDITKAKQIDRSKSEFVSLASHQLRTPLSAINWYAEMLLGGDAGKLQDKQQEYVSEIYGSSRRMAELVSALLNVSRIELGTFAIQPKPTDVREIVDSVAKELRPKIQAKNQIFTTDYSENVPKLVDVDPDLLRMTIQNLLSNSVKYTPDGGKMSISLSKSGDDLLIKVADNGYGIPLSQQQRIYEKFFRADNIIPVETDGTGLGLYMVREVIQRAGGTISFESEENKGTTFSISIPLTGMKKKEGTRSLSV